MKSGKKKLTGIIIALLVLAFAGYKIFWYLPPTAAIVVKKAEVRGKVHGPGTVRSRVPVTVSAKITGILEKLYADQGDSVRKGQLLAELDSAELRARETAAHAAGTRAERDLARARADLIKSQANLALAQSNYQRDLEVFKPGYISPAAFDATKAALRIAESDVAANEATVKALESVVNQAKSETRAAEALFGYTRILAPMDGVVTVRKAEVGNTVSPGTPIFQMVDYQIWAASWIDETKLAQLREGQKASITLRSGRVFQGEVARLNKEADTVTRELEVDVKFDSLPNPLVIGEETEVDIDTGRQTAPVVPLSAIVERNGSKGIMVVANGRAGFRPVVLGLQDGRRVTVPDGLREGAVAILNPAGIAQGKKVRPEIKSDMKKSM
ncbi:MAG: efflux RND transporter periplasmic adaptor subunit [Nitrospirae bacterium]|nr:efflux RND transporter periplasmic adaptor subunit [Nitrospirota bacterium]